MTRGTRPARATAAIPAQAGGHGHRGWPGATHPEEGDAAECRGERRSEAEPGHDGTAPPEGSTASAMTNQPAVPNRLQRPRAARWSHPQRPPITAGRSMGASRCGSRDRLDSRGSSRNASTRRRLCGSSARFSDEHPARPSGCRGSRRSPASTRALLLLAARRRRGAARSPLLARGDASEPCYGADPSRSRASSSSRRWCVAFGPRAVVRPGSLPAAI